MSDLSSLLAVKGWVKAQPAVVKSSFTTRPSAEYVRGYERGYERGYLDGIARAHELIDRLLNSRDPMAHMKITLFEEEMPR